MISERYKSQFLEVGGSRLHYLECGEGDPIIFLHGIPTSSYLWRNIMPFLSDSGHCFAPDLMGMGDSDKPDIEYRIFDHIKYIDEFIDQVASDKVTLVMHGWGSVIGFDYARRHEDKIKGIAFFESHIRPTVDWDMLSLPVQQFASLLNREAASFKAIVEQNYFIERLLPSGVVRQLTPEEMEQYRKPFLTPDSRKPLWQYAQDLPLGHGPDDVVVLIEQYSQWLQQTAIPKFMLYAVPGFITTIETVSWAKQHLPNLRLEELDDVMHFAQESVPEVFGQKLSDWYESLS